MAAVEEGQIEGCKDVVEAVRDIKEELVKSGQSQREVSQMRFWYRGHACWDWTLNPSGLRPPFGKTPGLLQTMLHEFRAEATVIHGDPPKHEDVRQWLFLMRHYEMPTLLIDWTRSPLTALYFAVEDRSETAGQDGALWMLRPGVWNRCAVPQSAKNGRDHLYEAYSRGLDGLFEVHFDKDRLVNTPKDATRIVALEPVYNSTRMIAQQSVFTINGPSSAVMEVAHRQFTDGSLWRWRIPQSRKGDLRQELHDLGVQRSSIFPDLDNLSRCIKARYGLPGTLAKPSAEPRVFEVGEGYAPAPSDITTGGEPTSSSFVS